MPEFEQTSLGRRMVIPTDNGRILLDPDASQTSGDQLSQLTGPAVPRGGVTRPDDLEFPSREGGGKTVVSRTAPKPSSGS